ncbi:hypothetical protein BS78_02G129800 [Paspalum vaginatum]|nr:hypothetical protein BS78_02G129800 [Paspalum vaginatum]
MCKLLEAEASHAMTWSSLPVSWDYWNPCPHFLPRTQCSGIAYCRLFSVKRCMDALAFRSPRNQSLLVVSGPLCWCGSAGCDVMFIQVRSRLMLCPELWFPWFYFTR